MHVDAGVLLAAISILVTLLGGGILWLVGYVKVEERSKVTGEVALKNKAEIKVLSEKLNTVSSTYGEAFIRLEASQNRTHSLLEQNMKHLTDLVRMHDGDIKVIKKELQDNTQLTLSLKQSLEE